jgi:uncharacterized protein YndB with AHSA1/START domain
MIDVTHQIGAVARTIGTRTLEAGEARVVTISQTYRADVDDVWDACTNPERIARWFLPVSGELKLGGRYQIEGNAGGTVDRCDPPHSFAATWEYGGEASWIEVRFTPEADDRTLFTLEHTAHVDDERWAQFGPGAVGIGWDLMAMGVALHLASGGSADPAEAQAWSVSPDGVRFMTEASDAWRAVSVAAGTTRPRRRRRRSGPRPSPPDRDHGRPRHIALDGAPA